jgi:hypothetical protein
MNPEKINTPIAEEATEETMPDNIDLAWIFGRLVSIMYFIEYQFGNEAGTIIEQIGSDVENRVRNGIGEPE